MLDKWHTPTHTRPHKDTPMTMRGAHTAMREGNTMEHMRKGGESTCETRAHTGACAVGTSREGRMNVCLAERRM